MIPVSTKITANIEPKSIHNENDNVIVISNGMALFPAFLSDALSLLAYFLQLSQFSLLPSILSLQTNVSRCSYTVSKVAWVNFKLTVHLNAQQFVTRLLSETGLKRSVSNLRVENCKRHKKTRPKEKIDIFKTAAQKPLKRFLKI